MNNICEMFSRGRLHHSAPSDIRTQLDSEADRRLEALVYEELFKAHLGKSLLNGDSHCSDWVICSAPSGNKVFYKAIRKKDLGNLNRASREFINAVDEQAYFVYEENNNIYAYDTITGVTTDIKNTMPNPSAYVDLSKHLNSSKNRERCIRFLLDKNLEVDAYLLSLNRRLMNCYLEFGYQRKISDLDVIAFVNNKLSYIEFKRKGPAPFEKFFGLDTFPHQHNANWLKRKGISSKNIILVPPFNEWKFDKKKVPFNNFHHPNKWQWLGCDLEPILNSKDFMSAKGEKGSMNKGSTSRKQVKIPWDSVQLINKGLELSKNDGLGWLNLRDFLSENLRDSPNIDFYKLKASAT
ncbi:MAG: hypothetical protein HWE18_06135 [Gammaproteobacteria bacterium]|nr:hypothetical protein [Gammaproteobacteria bacterium]